MLTFFQALVVSSLLGQDAPAAKDSNERATVALERLAAAAEKIAQEAYPAGKVATQAAAPTPASPPPSPPLCY